MNRHIFRAVLTLGLLVVGNGVMWGESEYYAKLTVDINSNSPTGSGRVYATNNGTTVEVEDEKTTASNYISTDGDGGGNTTLYGHAVAETGFHFVGWASTVGASEPDEGIGNPQEFSLATATTSGENNANKYFRYAIFDYNYYVSVSANHVGDGNTGSVIVRYEEEGGSNQATNGNGNAAPDKEETFSITATDDVTTGYHFVEWTHKHSLDDVKIETANSSTTNVTVMTKSDYQYNEDAKKPNPYQYTVTANYAKNIYYATLTANSGVNGTASINGNQTKSTESTETPGGSVEFSITASPSPGYHFKEWQVEQAEGDYRFKDNDRTLASTTFYAKVPSEERKYDEDNALSYKVKAIFEEDKFYAKLATAVSSKSDVSSSTAQVSIDETGWETEKTQVDAEKDKEKKFYVKATPAQGYKFIGWSEKDGTDDSKDFISLGASGEYKVKSSSNQGETNAKTLYAVFKKEYSIVINAFFDAVKDDRVVFSVVNNSDNSIRYRLSVPVGGSVTLKDVAPGNYTITPETDWSWNYTVTPENSSTEYDSVNMSTHNFTVSSKGSTKKIDEEAVKVEIDFGD